MAEVTSRDTVYDLGSGDGRIIIEASLKYNAHAVGIEADPFRILWSYFALLRFGLHQRVKLIWGNLFNKDISDATVVTLFLWKSTNQRLKPKLVKELKPGTRVVSYLWAFHGWEPIQMDVDDEIFLYEIGKSDIPNE
jgi:precorrin-6B methylase 2